MNPEQFFPKANLESSKSAEKFSAGQEIISNLRTEQEAAYELGGVAKNELFIHWPDPDQQSLIEELAGLYKNVTFEVMEAHDDGTIDIKPQSPEITYALLRQNIELRNKALLMKEQRSDGRDLLTDMAHTTLFGVNQEFFTPHERPIKTYYENLSLDDEVSTALTDPEEFVNQFGNALAFEQEHLPDEAQQLIKQASIALFTKNFIVDFIYDHDGETDNPLVKIKCIDKLSQNDIVENQLEDLQKSFNEKYGTDRQLLFYLQSSPMTVSVSALAINDM